MRSSLLAVAVLLMVAVLAAACGAPGDVAARPSGPTGLVDPSEPATAEGAATAADGAPTASSATEEQAAAGAPEGEQLRVRVVGRRPHDTSAFTQGLEFDGPRLYESRGLYGESAITEIDPQTGEVVRSTALDDRYFAEGATILDGQLFQITWRESTAFVYDPATFEVVGQRTYTTEGWGICDRAGELVMSDGTPTLTFRDPATFAPLRTVEVTRDGVPVDELNELECVGGRVWANVWQTDEIVVIDPADGQVVSTVDASGLLTEEERREADVLNGIAYDGLTDTWLLTGKLWPWMFEVEFDCVSGCAAASDDLSLLRGPTRIQTAVAVAQDGYPSPGSAAAAVLARADDPADALAGTPLAVAATGPVLLTATGMLDPDTAAELRRAVAPGAVVYLLGGSSALGAAVEDAVEDLGYVPRRVAGPSRFETAAAVADEVAARVGEPEEVFLVTGLDFRPALPAGAAAGATRGVLLLSNGSSRHPATDAWLLRHPLLPQHAVGSAAQDAYPMAMRRGGDDPYATAVDLAAFTHEAEPSAVALASAEAFPDGLAGGAHAARLGTALLLTAAGALPAPTAQYLEANAARLTRLVVYGGDAAIAPGTREAALAAMR